MGHPQEMYESVAGLADADRVRFGPYTLDLHSGELSRKDRSKILSDQRLTILKVLLRQPNRLVSNAELKLAIWGRFSEVDVDGSLDQILYRLRKDMEDSADEPRYVRRVHGRGAEFVARARFERRVAAASLEAVPVEQVVAAAPALTGERDAGITEVNAGPAEVLLRPAAAEPAAASSESIGTDSPARRRRGWLGVAAGLAVVFAGMGFWRLRPAMSVSRDILVATPLTNTVAGKLQPLVTDGSRLYFTQVNAGVWSIGEMSTGGGNTETIDTGVPNSDLSDVSPDGSTLLVRHLTGSRDLPAPFWVVPLVAGVPQRLGTLDGVDAAWSPDGTHIAVTTRHGVLVTDTQGKLIRRLVTVRGVPWWPRWSPDGARIRFTVSSPEWTSYSIWEIHSDGQGLRQLLPGWSRPSRECCGSWSPDGRTFVFQAEHGTPIFQIWALRRGWWPGRKLIQLTAGDVQFRGPAFSRHGRRIFVRGDLARAEVMRFDPATHAFTRLLNYDLACGATAIRPDGKWIACPEMPEGRLTWRRIDNTGIHDLSDPALQTALPVWSPDGRRIAFMGRHLGHQWRVYIASARTGLFFPLPGRAGQADPTWSPDGSRLAIGAPLGVPPEASRDLAVYTLATRKLLDLPGTRGLFEPRWSPNGKTLAALRPGQPPGTETVSLYDLGTQQPNDLATIDGGYLNWSHDGRWLYFLDSSRPHADQVARLDLHGRVQPVAESAFH